MGTDTIRLRAPSIYGPKASASQSQRQSSSPTGSAATWQPPALPWLARTWSVTHSTLPMWRQARNVRITYTLLPPRPPPGGSGGEGGLVRIDDELLGGAGLGEFESHAHGGAATTEKERWVVTWFKASLFTPMGVDVYSDRKEGMSEGLYRMISAALERGEAGEEVAGMCRAEMREVEIKY
ncbi:hypothetical protein QTJ16_000762 [Diplocarpon rosae]|uniref:Uncharacterized protein n=1 Tax=Diplocarpon rosae TaxID=946125 RepID=A0AAD9WFM6_9HELO|nr:hypothetical protein QTJ16_000762 [Diplocarpon rosae]